MRVVIQRLDFIPTNPAFFMFLLSIKEVYTNNYALNRTYMLQVKSSVERLYKNKRNMETRRRNYKTIDHQFTKQKR